MKAGTELARSWHVLAFNYYMNLVEDCLCPKHRKKLLGKAEAHIQKFEATFEEPEPVKGSSRHQSPGYAES